MAIPWNFTLNVNLQEGSAQQLDFLQEVANHPALSDEKVLKHCRFRYEHYWLPLAGKHPNETLAAPLDVEWIWLCHMLSPVDYQRDCNLVAGRVVSHKLYSAMQRRKFQQKARSLWQVEYPQEPFILDLDSDLYFADDDLPSRLSVDVLAAAVRQKIFFYQVSLPHFKDAKFLSTCELRYKRFLYLKQQNPDADLVPSYDIDLMWHTHMLHPLAYKIDTETVLGYTLDHDKLLDGADPGLHVSEAFNETRELWRRTFDVNFEVCGATYRGCPTAGKLHALTPQQNFMASTKTATFIIEKVDVQGLPALKGKLVFKLYTGLNGKVGKCAATFKGEPPWQGKAVPATDFETQTVNYLKIRVLDQTGVLACFGTREIIGEKDIDLRPTLDSLTHETSVEHSVSLSQVYGATVALVTTHFCWPQRGPVHLYLRVGIFTKSPVPEKPESVFCHVPIRKMPTGIENATYLAASHSFVNHSESVVLTCRVLHSVDLLQSALYVHYQDKMAAVAHLVGLDQLPLPTQISDPRKVPYLNPRAGERAVLIKNHSGDWAVVIGRWTAVRKGGSRMGSRRGKDGLPGQLMIRVREMADFGWRELQLTYSEQHWRFTLDDLHADLKDGTIRIDNPDSQYIAEKVALTFGVALLHVLCMPRPSGWRRGTSLRPRTSRRGTRSSKWIPSDEMPFILAAGVLQETPTNGYIRQTHGTGAWSSDREALLGPANTDLQSCRPEDGLGGMWAHVTPGLNELFVQGAHVVPDGNSSTSAQFLADGNSSCSQIFIDNSACGSPPPSQTAPASAAAVGVAVVAGVAAGRDSNAASERKAGESDGKAPVPGVTLTVPGGKTAAAASPQSLMTIPDGIPALIVSDETTTVGEPFVTSTGTLGGKNDGGVTGERLDSDEVAKLGATSSSSVAAAAAAAVVPASPSSSSAFSARKAGSSGGAKFSAVSAAAKAVPGEKSLGIAALAMLGGKMTSALTSPGSVPRSALPLPSVAVVDTESDDSRTPTHGTVTAGKEHVPIPALQLVTPTEPEAGAEEFSSSDDVEDEDETADERTLEKKNLSAPKILSVAGPTHVEQVTVEEETRTPSSGSTSSPTSPSSSSASLQGICDMHPLPTMLGLPDCVSPFHGSQLSARDMIDICEERIYSDYKCSLETGGVDDLILNDSRFDDVDEEIIVAVQSRRNSRRKDGPNKTPAAAAVLDSAGGDNDNTVVAAAAPTAAGGGGGEGGPAPSGDDFVSSLTAALAATLGDGDKDRTGDSRTQGLKDVTVSDDQPDGTCGLNGKGEKGDCGEDVSDSNHQC